MYSSMSLCCSNMSAGRGIIGTFTAVLLWRFMPTCSKGLAVPYLWSDITKYLTESGKLRIIPSCRYDLELDVPGQ